MERYNIFQALYMSFYSRKLYRDVAFNWGAKTFVYLLLLLSLTWVVFTYQLQQIVNQGYLRMADPIVAQAPTVTLKDGKVITPENRPYIVTDPQTHETLLVIDTSGKYTSLDQIQTDILVTETKVFSKPKENQQRIDEIPSKLNMTIYPDHLNTYAKKFIGFLWMPMFVFALMISYVYRIIQSLVYAIIGRVLAPMLNVRLSYWQIVQIMMVAITPVIIICTTMRALHLDVMHHNLFYFLLAMAYMIYGMLANKA